MATPKHFSPRQDDEVLDMTGSSVWFTKSVAQAQGESAPVYLVRAVSPETATFDVPAHWHPETDEYFTVFAGRLHVTLGGKQHIVTPADGELKIPRGVVHALHSPMGEFAEFAERADPNPESKVTFLLRLIKGSGQDPVNGLQALTIFYQEGDAFPSTGLKILDRFMVYVVGGFFGNFLGFGGLKGKDD